MNMQLLCKIQNQKGNEGENKVCAKVKAEEYENLY